MINNDLLFLIASMSIGLVMYIIGYMKGMDWASKAYDDVLEKSKHNCEESMKIADEWRESAVRLLREKYSDPTGNGGGFKHGNQN